MLQFAIGRQDLKKRLRLFVVALLSMATPLFAGLRYEFTESTRTEETAKTTHLVARAVVEGAMSRLDVLSGDRYEPGSYILTHGDNRIYVVNPAQKSYAEYSGSDRPVNPERVQIKNVKSNFIEVPEATPVVIAGYPTRHFRLQLTYDIEVQMGTITIRQSVETAIDKWVTNAFDHIVEQYRANLDDVKTGNPQIDALIATEASRFRGLPLRERSQIVTRAEKSKSSKVNLPTTRKRTREMTVSRIEEVTVSPNFFAIPVDYKLGQATKPPGTTTQYLTMQPETP
jgi:hypothetical protein